MIIGYADLHNLLDTVLLILVFVLGIWLGTSEKASRKKTVERMKKLDAKRTDKK